MPSPEVLPSPEVWSPAMSLLHVDDLIAAWHSSPAMIAITVGDEHRLAYQNLAWVRRAGRRTLGEPFAVAFPGAGPADIEALDRVLTEAVAYEREPTQVGLLGATDLPLYLHYAYAPLGRSGQGRAIGVLITAVDVTERDVTIALRRALLPAVPAGLVGAQLAARYVAGSERAAVGGDWWDVVTWGVERIGFGVGDVAGRGVQAAIVMGQARAAMRAAALAGLGPGRLLSLLDTVLIDVLAEQDEAAPGPGFATAAYAVIDLAHQIMRVANAGHPPLVVRYPDGRTALVHAPPGPPLGLGLAHEEYAEVVVPFPAGSLLAAYTDGLVESHTRQVDEGVLLLREQLAQISAQDDLEPAIDRLLRVMGRDGDHDDDVALVLLRTQPPDEHG